MSDRVSQATIAAIFSNAYRSFAWGKRAYTWKTMLQYIHDIAIEEFQLSLADLEASSRKLASNMTREEYDIAVIDYNWQNDPNLLKEYNSIPYIFNVFNDCFFIHSISRIYIDIHKFIKYIMSNIFFYN